MTVTAQSLKVDTVRRNNLLLNCPWRAGENCLSNNSRLHVHLYYIKCLVYNTSRSMILGVQWYRLRFFDAKLTVRQCPMRKSDITKCKSLTLQALKSLVVLTLTLPTLMLFASAVLVGALGSLTGQSGIELAVTFIVDAAPTVATVSIQLMLAVYCIAAIHSVLSIEHWTSAHPRRLAARLYAKITGLVRLWASLASTVVAPLMPTHTSRRGITHWKLAAIHPTPYLAGEAPQLE